MGIPKDILRTYPCLSEWGILIGYRGSIAHGLYMPQSDKDSIDDKDIMGVCIPPKDYYFGLKQFGSRGTKEIKKDEWDIVVYEFKKFIHLLEKGNPNVLMMLWLESYDYLYLNNAGRHLVSNRDLFVTKQVYHSFVGYAHSQLHRMEHYKHEGYMGEKRKKLVAKYGYDTKNASHLIRLLKMGTEFLLEGYMYVKRKDSAQLLDIKKGKWTLEQIKDYANKLFKDIETVYINSKLPNRPNKETINKLCLEIMEEYFSNTYL